MRNISLQSPRSKPRQRKLPLAPEYSRPLGDAGPADATEGILTVHRDPDGVIIFSRRAGPSKILDKCAIPTSRILNTLPGIFTGLLRHDAYFTVHTFDPPRGAWPASDVPGTLFPGFPGRYPSLRCRENARRLNAAFVDVDPPDSTSSLTPEQIATVEAAIRAVVDEGTIPPWSLRILSGRGVWFLWLLNTDADAALPPRADDPALFLYDVAQQALQDRLRDRIPAPGKIDPAVKDVARLTRVPGSINSKSGDVVQWSPVRSLPVYTLRDFCDRLGVHESDLAARAARALRGRDSRPGEPETVGPTVPRQPTFTPGTAHQRTADGRFLKGHRLDGHAESARLGGLARWWRQLENFERLRKLRAGFRAGHRQNAAFVLALILRRLRDPHKIEARTGRAAHAYTPEQIRAYIAEIGAECSPPLSAKEQAHAIRMSRKYQRPSWAQNSGWIADLLNVTTEEAVFLPTWNQTRPRPEGQQRSTRSSAIKRRIAIRAIVRELRFTPTQTAMQEKLAARGFNTSRRNIADDYRALSLSSGSNRGRRRHQTPLPLTGVSQLRSRTH